MNNMEKMLKTASAKLGMEPEELRQALTKGDINAITAKMNDSDAQKLKNAIANPKVAEMLKDSPEMAEYMNNVKE